jgi:N-ethylmaleimide reductase
MTADFRAPVPYVPSKLLSAGDIRRSPAQHLCEDGTADLISYGARFLANPDLPRRLARGGPYNRPHRDSFYGGAEYGYTDYPFLAESDIA